MSLQILPWNCLACYMLAKDSVSIANNKVKKLIPYKSKHPLTQSTSPRNKESNRTIVTVDKQFRKIAYIFN